MSKQHFWRRIGKKNRSNDSGQSNTLDSSASSPLHGSKAEPIESFLLLIGERTLTMKAAIDLIESAKLIPYVDLDRLMRWDYHNLIDENGELAKPIELTKPIERTADFPTSSMYGGLIQWQNRVFSFFPKNFVYLHRSIYDFQEVLLMPSKEIADLCWRVGDRIKSTPLEYSFKSGLAYRLEAEGDRAQAKTIWSRYKMTSMKQWIQRDYEPLFLEIQCGENPDQDKLQHDPSLKTLRDIAQKGHEEALPEREYIGLRNLGLAYAVYGALEPSITTCERAIACSESFLEPIAKLVLLGDALWISINLKDDHRIKKYIEEMVEHIKNVPKYVGCAAIFARSALLCSIVGHSTGEWKFLSVVSGCLE